VLLVGGGGLSVKMLGWATLSQPSRSTEHLSKQQNVAAPSVAGFLELITHTQVTKRSTPLLSYLRLSVARANRSTMRISQLR
jgi:hypothetical protein